MTFNLIYAQADQIIVIGRDMEMVLRQKKYKKTLRLFLIGLILEK